jgi:hypothetical protein
MSSPLSAPTMISYASEAVILSAAKNRTNKCYSRRASNHDETQSDRDADRWRIADNHGNASSSIGERRTGHVILTAGKNLVVDTSSRGSRCR